MNYHNPIFTVIETDDMPIEIIENKVFVIGEGIFKWLAVFVCPCGCKEIIQLNLLKESDPCWRVVSHKKKIATIRPSVWRITGCKSHFNMRKGRILWVLDYYH